MECGIVGLPGSGKTSLFRALTGAAADAAPDKPNIAVASIPDPRLAVIARYITTRKVTPATITFVDIPGLDPEQAARSGAMLAHVRQVDALCQVVRCFEGAYGPVDPQRDIARFEEELVLADLTVAEPALDKAQRPARTGDADAKARAAMLARVVPVLEEGRALRSVTDWTEPEEQLLRSYGFVTAKRSLYVANVSEDEVGTDPEAARLVHEHAAAVGGEAVTLCATLEAELAELSDDDRREMLAGLGLAEPAIGPMARAACRLLGLQVFYTAGEKEVRAWTVDAGATAPQAAGAIHSDLERGFIRAECYHIEDLVELESEKAIRAAGRLRTEGKSYHVRDGDVIHVLFNV